jgi:hypothetical protein
MFRSVAVNRRPQGPANIDVLFCGIEDAIVRAGYETAFFLDLVNCGGEDAPALTSTAPTARGRFTDRSGKPNDRISRSGAPELCSFQVSKSGNNLIETDRPREGNFRPFQLKFQFHPGVLEPAQGRLRAEPKPVKSE